MSSNLFLDLPKSVFEVLTDEQIAKIVRNEYSKANECPTISINTDVPTPSEPMPENYKRHIPIWKHKKFHVYKKQRVYNEKTHVWTVKGKNKGRGKKLRLSIEVLFTIIEFYIAGYDAVQINNKLGLYKSHQGMQAILNIYKAGGFNDAIYEYALKYGYKPNDLISKEYIKGVDF